MTLRLISNSDKPGMTYFNEIRDRLPGAHVQDTVVFKEGSKIYAFDVGSDSPDLLEEGKAGEDDTSVLQTAINNGSDVRVASADYLTTKQVEVKSGTRLWLSEDAIIKPQGNHNGLLVRPDSIVHGGTVDCSDPSTWNSTAVLVQNVAGTWFERDELSGINSLVIRQDAPARGTGLKLLAEEDGEIIQWCHYNNINISRFNIGLHLVSKNTGNGGDVVFINSNGFSNIGINRCPNGVRMTGDDTSPGMIAANFFQSVHVQSTDSEMETGIEIRGVDNVFDGARVWDWAPDSGKEKRKVIFNYDSDPRETRNNTVITPGALNQDHVTPHTEEGNVLKRGSRKLSHISEDLFRIGPGGPSATEPIYLLFGPLDQSDGLAFTGRVAGDRYDSGAGGAFIAQVTIRQFAQPSSGLYLAADITDSPHLHDQIQLKIVEHDGEDWAALEFKGSSSNVYPSRISWMGKQGNMDTKAVQDTEVSNIRDPSSHSDYRKTFKRFTHDKTTIEGDLSIGGDLDVGSLSGKFATDSFSLVEPLSIPSNDAQYLLVGPIDSNDRTVAGRLTGSRTNGRIAWAADLVFRDRSETSNEEKILVSMLQSYRPQLDDTDVKKVDYDGKTYVAFNFTGTSSGYFNEAEFNGHIQNAEIQIVLASNVSNVRDASTDGRKHIHADRWDLNATPEFNGNEEVEGVTQKGTTSNRPSSPNGGQRYFDTDLGKPIWWDGSNWIDATGTVV